MQEVIDALLKAEAEAQKIIAAAQEEARRLRAQADADLSLKLNQAREEARRSVLDRVDLRRREIQAAQAAALEAERVKNEDRFRREAEVMEQLTDEVVSLVMTPEYERDE